MKILGIVGLVGVVIIYGFSLSSRYLNRIKVLEAMILFIDFAENRIRYLGCSVEKIIKDAADDKRFNVLDFIEKKQNGYSCKEIIDNCKNKTFLCEIDKENIIAFFYDLGSKDIDGEIAHCKLYKKIITNHYELAKTEYNNKGKLYKTMSIIIGFAITIIFI